MKRLTLIAGVLVLFAIAGGPVASAAVAWPADSAWIPLTHNGTNYWDVPNDYSPAQVDIVGGIDPGGTNYTAGFWFNDGTNLMFRMRCDDFNVASHNYVWQIMMETTGDSNLDFSLQADHKSDNRVEFHPVTGTTDFSQPVVNSVDIATLLWSGDLAVYHDHGLLAPSVFNNNADYFMEIAMPLTNFFTNVPLGTNLVHIVLATSADHNQLNKDRPDQLNFFSDPIFVPEPGTIALLAAGAAFGFVRRRRSRR